ADDALGSRRRDDVRALRDLEDGSGHRDRPLQTDGARPGRVLLDGASSHDVRAVAVAVLATDRLLGPRPASPAFAAGPAQGRPPQSPRPGHAAPALRPGDGGDHTNHAHANAHPATIPT